MKGEPAARYTLTGLQKTWLETVRSRMTPADGPAYDMAADLTDDGEVRFRPATLDDQLDQLIVRWVWENQHRWLGEEVE